mgnify:CR=1 FL=1
MKWISLEVLRAEASRDAGVVEFIACCRVTGRAQRIHEVSRFVRQDARWYYIDGQVVDDGR